MSTLFWCVYPSGQADPTATEIINGTVPNGIFGQDVAPAEDTVGFLGTVITGLTPDTSYKLAGVWSDGAGNDSNIEITAPFVTEPALPAGGNIRLGSVPINKAYFGGQQLPQAYLGDIPLLSTELPYQIPYSCMLSDGSNSRLIYSPAAASPDYESFTFSTWFKRTRVGQSQVLYVGHQANNAYSVIRINGNDELEWYDRNSGGFFGEMPTDAVFRDPSAWYHLVFQYDSDNPDTAERVRMWVNGVRMSLRTVTEVQLGRQPWMNSASTHYIGWSNADNYSDILMAETIMVDGAHVAPTAFGVFDNNSVWQPIDFAATAPYGTNGYRLGYASPTNLGEDISGNGNNFSLNNVSESNAFTDTPSENFCTLLEVDPRTTGTITEGGLVTTGNAAVSMRPENGEWYYERNGVGVVYDADASGEFDPVLSAGSYNFGQRPWQGIGPVGDQQALSSSNLPAPVISKGSSHMVPALYAGNGTTQDIGGMDFAPDLVWIKNRTSAVSHAWFDTTRGEHLYMSCDSTTVEGDATPNGVSAFNANGFTVNGADSRWNRAGDDYVAWCWDAAALPGFEAVGYVGNGNSNRDIPHNLGAVPKMMIIKRRNEASEDWTVYNEIDGPSYSLALNENGSRNLGGARWGDTAPTDTVFTVGSLSVVNASGSNYIAYLFAEVPGFSKVGSYTGNGNGDGPVVHCGFSPAFVMIKRTDSNGGWNLVDSTRDPYNVTVRYLLAQSNAAESANREMDWLATGFKIRNTDTQWNNNGSSYVYIAFAEHPLQTARAR